MQEKINHDTQDTRLDCGSYLGCDVFGGKDTMIKIPNNPNYSKNQERIKGDFYPCLVCGKAVTTANPKMARMWNGDTLVTDEEALDMNSSGDMGYYPIGSECLRNHPELKRYCK